MPRTTSARTVFTLTGILLLIALTAADMDAQSTTVVLVRHAEKADDSSDTPLSAAGQRRAESLRAALEDAGVQGIITTQYQRTRDTAAPLAATLGLDPVVVTSAGNSAAHAAEIAERIGTWEAGATVLIVGHSNTVPAIIRALGGADVGRIEDDEYSNLFVVLIGEGGTRIVRGRY